jgi:cardiolipin synthase
MGEWWSAFQAWRETDAAAISAALLALHVLISVVASCHVLLTKDNVRASVGWIGLVVLSPFVGTIVYWIFGINRIERKFAAPIDDPGDDRAFWEISGPVTPLLNGDEAFPAMLAAISGARESVALSSYIFDRDESGLRFVEALAAAQARGVTVRVLVDDVGIRYSRRPVDRDLAASGVRTARFMPTRSLSLLSYVNLRSHRKLLVIDGECAFLGGMNIRHGNCLREEPAEPVQDVHFRFCGPVVAPLARVFEEDWEFAAREAIRLPRPAAPGSAGEGRARVIADGPDDGVDKLQWTFLAALSSARHRARIVTPYFLPNEVLINGLAVACMNGVTVEVIVPRQSNLFYMDWPMMAVFERLVPHGVNVYLADPPFDHSKIFLVDDDWCSIGSSNWDDRSLRLNFELNLEIVDRELARQLHTIVDRKRAASRRLTAEEFGRIALPRRLRNRFLRLFSPYL